MILNFHLFPENPLGSQMDNTLGVTPLRCAAQVTFCILAPHYSLAVLVAFSPFFSQIPVFALELTRNFFSPLRFKRRISEATSALLSTKLASGVVLLTRSFFSVVVVFEF